MTEPLPESNRAVFSELMREHQRELILFTQTFVGNREAAKDVLQEAFVTAWRNFEKFDQTRDFSAWMRGIIRHRALDWFRASKRGRAKLEDLREVEEMTQDWFISESPYLDRLEFCLQRLPVPFHRAIQECYFRGLNSREAASELQVSDASLRKRLERARRKLYQCLMGENKEASA